jgi:cell wall-associated NlpC family hydrolase
MELIVTAAVAPLLAAPTVRAEQVSQLVLGETAEELAREGDWRRVRVRRDGYEGWLNAGYSLAATPEAAAGWRARARGWSAGATLDAGGRRVRLPLGARVELRPDGAVRLPDGRCGAVVAGAVEAMASVEAAARAEAPERWALARFEGAPYEWGGITPWGVDCSGLVQATFGARGTALPRDASQQAGAGDPVPLDALEPGDLLFFRSEHGGDAITHVAFCAEGGGIVHSTLACGGVLAESFAPGSRGGSLRERLVAVRRLERR